MSDEASTPAKRGRKAASAVVEKPESKKRPRKEVKQADSGDEDGVASKRGRGRPKGTTKKKSAAKPKAKSASGRRGRKKEEKKKDSDDDNEENGAEEDEDD